MNTIQSRSMFEPRRAGAIGMIVILIALLIAVGLPRLTSGDDETAAMVDVERKQVVDPPKELADFTLTGQDGQPVSLSDLRGKPALVYFGFTRCPDVCPTTLAQFGQIKGDLGERGSDVNFVFISVDGSRDTPEVVKAFVEKFDPGFVGLTGAEDEVRTIGRDYFVFFNRARPEETPSTDGYSVDHTMYTYLIDAGGNLRTIYPFMAPSEMIIKDIESLLTS